MSFDSQVRFAKLKKCLAAATKCILDSKNGYECRMSVRSIQMNISNSKNNNIAEINILQVNKLSIRLPRK